MDIHYVDLAPQAKKDLRGMPDHIIDKLESWMRAVERDGLREVRKIPGYHDEPLKGGRIGQRSIRLNRAYRAIYVVKKGKEIEFLWVEEVNKHEY
jgi:proteic killer suppression protein